MTARDLTRSYDRDSRQSTIHMVSAFAAQNRLVLGQVKTDASPTKLPPFLELLAILDALLAVFSIDAMGCQTPRYCLNHSQNGGDPAGSKGNQPSLHSAVRAAQVESMNKPLTEETVSIEKQHGRIDGREYHVLPAGALASNFP